jgi:ketosteroid isomerase-like protein
MTASPANITERYFAAANRADLLAVKAMFQPDATYSSAHTGLFYGIADIMDMMHTFFQDHQRLHWQINQLTVCSEHITEVTFTLLATTRAGDTFERSGTERLVIGTDGLIRHIEIR